MDSDKELTKAKVKFTLSDTDGNHKATLRLIRFSSHIFAIICDISNEGEAVTPAEFGALVNDALKHALTQGARRVKIRLVEKPDTDSFMAELRSIGFSKKFDRVEFRRAVDELPGDDGSPIHWEPIEPSGSYTLIQTAELYAEISECPASNDSTRESLDELNALLDEPGLTNGSGCVHVGLVQGSPVALVVAQVEEKTGWSRITTMGIVPSHRGRRLGGWVHRHGFSMLRSQGGKFYHGGTLATNTPMIKLFNLHGCKEFRKMQ